MKIIKTTDDLKSFSDELRQRPFVAVDTEFMREKTYWPILCLIQAAAEGVEAIIDPLADGLDLSPFLEMLADDNVVKVFHAARQDLEIFHLLMKTVPAPLFDSQIAAMACGFGDQIGYEPLMRNLLGAQIDKGPRFTDWSRRPLSDAQLSYALSDVTHLREAYPLLLEKLDADDRHRWVEEEMGDLLNPKLYFVEPESAWRRLKIRGVRPADMGAIIKLSEWREQEAQNRDVPRRRILKDEAIFELARLKPSNPKELAGARSIPTGFERSKSSAGILSAIQQGSAIKRSDLPSPDRDKQRATPPADIVDLLKVLLKRQCETYHVAPKLIASSSDIEELAMNDEAAIPALQGWRRELYGDLALKLKRGAIALTLNNGKLDIVEMS